MIFDDFIENALNTFSLYSCKSTPNEQQISGNKKVPRFWKSSLIAFILHPVKQTEYGLLTWKLILNVNWTCLVLLFAFSD